MHISPLGLSNSDVCGAIITAVLTGFLYELLPNPATESGQVCLLPYTMKSVTSMAVNSLFM